MLCPSSSLRNDGNWFPNRPSFPSQTISVLVLFRPVYSSAVPALCYKLFITTTSRLFRSIRFVFLLTRCLGSIVFLPCAAPRHTHTRPSSYSLWYHDLFRTIIHEHIWDKWPVMFTKSPKVTILLHYTSVYIFVFVRQSDSSVSSSHRPLFMC